MVERGRISGIDVEFLLEFLGGFRIITAVSVELSQCEMGERQAW